MNIVEVNLDDIKLPEPKIEFLNIENIAKKVFSNVEDIVLNVCVDEHGNYILCDNVVKYDYLKILKISKVKVNVLGKCSNELIYQSMLKDICKSPYCKYINKLSLLKVLYYLHEVLKIPTSILSKWFEFHSTYIRKMISVAKEINELNLWNVLPPNQPISWYIERRWKELTREKEIKKEKDREDFLSELTKKIKETIEAKEIETKSRIEVKKKVTTTTFTEVEIVKEKINELVSTALRNGKVLNFLTTYFKDIVLKIVAYHLFNTYVKDVEFTIGNICDLESIDGNVCVEIREVEDIENWLFTFTKNSEIERLFKIFDYCLEKGISNNCYYFFIDKEGRYSFKKIDEIAKLFSIILKSSDKIEEMFSKLLTEKIKKLQSS